MMRALFVPLLLAATPVVAAPPPPGEPPERISTLVVYGRDPCPRSSGDEIVVCARHGRPDPRLPLPDERFGPGEVVRHPGEAPSATNAFRGPPREPSKLMETIFKGAGLIKGAITGEDPDFIPPR